MARKNETVDDYIKTRTPLVAALIKELREFALRALPGSSEAMQYGAPVIVNALGTPVIYLFGAKEHVNFGFLRSAELSDPDAVLRGSGKPSKHVRLLCGKPIDKDLLLSFVKQCEGIQPER